MLIVDDNPGFRRLARRFLEYGGFVVVATVRDAGEALLAVEGLAPEVVLLDVNLPDASGFELAARLMHGCPELAVLLTSTRGGCDFEQRALASGAVGFVQKDDLSRAVLEGLLG